MRTANKLRILLLCGVIGVFACPHWSVGAKKIAFSDPSDPLAEMDTKQQERTPAKKIGKLSGDPGTVGDFEPPPMAIVTPRHNNSNSNQRDSKRDPFGQRDSQRDSFSQRASQRDSQRDSFGQRDSERGLFAKSDSNRKDDNNKNEDGLLSPHMKSTSFEKGWTSRGSKDSTRSAQNSRNDSESDYRDSSSGVDDFRRSADTGSIYPDRQRADDVLKRGFDRMQRPAETLAQANALDTMVHSAAIPSMIAPAETVSSMHDSIWKNSDDHSSLSSHSGDFSPREQDSFTSTIAGRSRYSGGDLMGGASLSSPTYQTRSLSVPDQSSFQGQKAVFLPFPKSPSSVLK